MESQNTATVYTLAYTSHPDESACAHVQKEDLSSRKDVIASLIPFHVYMPGGSQGMQGRRNHISPYAVAICMPQGRGEKLLGFRVP